MPDRGRVFGSRGDGGADRGRMFGSRSGGGADGGEVFGSSGDGGMPLVEWLPADIAEQP